MSGTETLHSSSTNCGGLILVECSNCNEGSAFQIAAELLRWPEGVAVRMHRYECVTFPDIPVNNKYFSTRVRVMIVSSDALGADTPAAELSHTKNMLHESTLLQPYFMNSFGWVLLVDGSVHPNQLPWHRIPISSLFRVVMHLHTTGTGVQEEVWHDACVANGFEYVPHLEDYEVIPLGTEMHGLLEGDHHGSARLLQILHNTMWPAACSVPKRGSCKGDEEDQEEKRHSGSLRNDMIVVGFNGNSVIDWLCTKCKDTRFFTAQWPLEAETTNGKQTEFTSWNTAIKKENKTLVLANKYYTTTVEVHHVHPAFFFPDMSDLFRAQYFLIAPQLAVIYWPPTSSAQDMNRDTYPPLPVLIQQLGRWGVKDHVILLSRGEESISPIDRQYCEDHQTEVLCDIDDENFITTDSAGSKAYGTVGADRLAEIIHTVLWPQHTNNPQPPPSSTPQSFLSKNKCNRVLYWACAPSAVEEENILFLALHKSFPALHDLATTAPLSMMSPSVYAPLTEISVRNRYFEAPVYIHSFGGARSAILRESEPTAEELNKIGVVVLLTRADGSKVRTCSALTSALEKCAIAQGANCGVGDSSALIIDGEQHGCDVTQQLCRAAEGTPDYLWCVVGGDESNDLLVAQVGEMWRHAAVRAREVVSASAMFPSSSAHSDNGHDGVILSDSSGGDDDDDDVGDDFLPVSFEVLYGEGDVDCWARLQDVVQHHVWPHRTLAAEEPRHEVPEDAAEKKECDLFLDRREEDDVVGILEDGPTPLPAGCELPPDYLVDPVSRRSVRVVALARPSSGGEKTEQHAEMEQELVAWMETMKRHGHMLPRTVRQRQAGLLASKLGSLLVALDNA